MASFFQRLQLLRPSSFRKFTEQLSQRSYQSGWNNGFDIGHRRGWMQLRSKITKAHGKFPHEQPAERM